MLSFVSMVDLCGGLPVPHASLHTPTLYTLDDRIQLHNCRKSRQIDIAVQ